MATSRAGSVYIGRSPPPEDSHFPSSFRSIRYQCCWTKQRKYARITTASGPVIKLQDNYQTSRPTMNRTDGELQQAEADVSNWGEEKHRNSAEADRPTTSGTTGSSSGSSSSVEYDPDVHRLQSRNTEVDLERRRSTTSQALSRIETQRLQHQLTVGESVKSRVSKTPLPAFGAGKPYPPQLPNRDDYVVEFDGPDDPLYPQNWPLWTK